MNVLISIGCNKYDQLPALNGAERDSEAIFQKLVDVAGTYDSSHSKLLKSPRISELRECFKQVFSQNPKIEIFTFFFAGHSGVKSGSYYLFLQDSDSESASTTAFPIIELFGIINERKPGQVNIIIDGCQSGGSSFDLHQLIKPDLIGSADSTRITFLAACTAQEWANETNEAGDFTAEILKCLEGHHQIQTRRPYLDLLEIASHTSRAVAQNNSEQRPVAWALNLHGYGRFAKNPCFAKLNETIDLASQNEGPGNSPNGEFSINSADIFAQVRILNDGFHGANFIQFLKNTFPQLLNAPEETLPFLQTVVNVLAGNADQSTDGTIKSQCLASSAVVLLPVIENDLVRQYVNSVFQQVIQNNTSYWNRLEVELDAGNESISSRFHPHAELLYLPLRITKILGWLAWEMIAETFTPLLGAGNNELRFRVASKLVNRYPSALAAVSDEQAPFLYLFSKACALNRQNDLLRTVLNAIFGSLSERRGNIINSGADAKRIFKYISSLNPNIPPDPLWRSANPMSLLSVLLLAGREQGLGSSWSLRDLDRLGAGFYIPSDYLHFSETVMSNGTNFVRRVGYDFWNVKQFHELFSFVFDRELKAMRPVGTMGTLALVALASIILPNRVPFCLEAHISAPS